MLVLKTDTLTRSLAAKPIFPWVPSPGKTFAEVPAGYPLWCRCMTELRALNDKYQWHLTMHIIS